MLRIGARLFIIGGRRCKSNNYSIPLPTSIQALRLTQSLVQITTSEGVTRSKEDCSPQILRLLSSVQDLGFDEDEIKTVIENQPELIMKSPTLWRNTVDSLLNHNLSKSDILSILEKWPQILSLNKSELDRNLDTWYGCGFKEELVRDILTAHPYFLQVNHIKVQKRIKQYQAYFESKNRAGKLLLLAPNTLEERWDELSDKLNYLDELCTEKSDIVSTGVLAHNALHIRARHEFLIRAGLYKKPGKGYIKKLCQNPKLSDIVNSTDVHFTTNVARLSLQEYEVFFEMFEKEFEESKDKEIDSDDEESYALSYKKPRRPRRT